MDSKDADQARAMIVAGLGELDRKMSDMRLAFAKRVVAALRKEAAAEQRRRNSLGVPIAEPMVLTPAMIMRVMMEVDAAADVMYGKQRGDGGGQLGKLIDESTAAMRQRVWDAAAQDTRDILGSLRISQLQALSDEASESE